MSDEADIRSLYQNLLDAWNRRDAEAFAALFGDEGQLVSADGSEMTGQSQMGQILGGLFATQEVGLYLGIVRSVRLLGPDAGILRAVSGRVPAGQTDIDPDFNAVQSLVAVRQGGQWRIALCQNTSAAYGGPEAMQALAEELRQLL